MELVLIVGARALPTPEIPAAFGAYHGVVLKEQFRLWLYIGCGAAWAFSSFLACDDDPLRTEPLTGRFVLQEFNGLDLPVDEGPVPNRDGTFGPAHTFLVCGFVVLRDDTGTFELLHRRYVVAPPFEERLDQLRPCTEIGISTEHLEGTYTQGGSLIRFHVPSPADPSRDFDFTGIIRNNSLEVLLFEDELIFGVVP